jgi:hypothetical protein
MTGERRSGGWRSETVLAAIVTAVAGVVVAIVGLFGGFGGGGDDGPTPTVSPEPTISIKETTFAAGGTGAITIRVTGSTTAFRSGDRLYAIARPQAVKRWWVSDPVVPVIGGDWVALIQASPGDGEQLTVSAVRIPAEELAGVGPGDVPTTGSPTSSPTASPSGPSRGERIEAELRVGGERARPVEVFSAAVAVLAPSR